VAGGGWWLVVVKRRRRREEAYAVFVGGALHLEEELIGELGGGTQHARAHELQLGRGQQPSDDPARQALGQTAHTTHDTRHYSLVEPKEKEEMKKKGGTCLLGVMRAKDSCSPWRTRWMDVCRF
jgi:hypothetical protein